MRAWLLLALLASSAVAGETQLAGRYRWVGGPAELERLDRAIETVVQKMNIFIRGIARRRIRGPNQPSAELEIIVAGGQIVIRRPGRPEVSAPADGRVIAWRDPKGDVFDVSHGIDADGLYQRFEDKRSQTLNRFFFDGPRLIVSTTTHSKYFAVPLQFRTTYERIP